MVQAQLQSLRGPSLRPKARYMNLERVLRWARKMLDLLDRVDQAQVDRERLEEKYGWVRDFRDSILEWSQWQAVTQTAATYVCREGYHAGAHADLAGRFAALDLSPTARSLADDILTFVAGQSAAAKPFERLIGSTEILESILGKFKQLERQQSQSGFTGLVLVLGILVGRWTDETIQKALERTPVKTVKAWCTPHLGPSLQAQRQQAFADPKA